MSLSFDPGPANGAVKATIDAADVDFKGRVNVYDRSWLVPQYNPFMTQDAMVLKHILSEAPRQLSYFEISVIFEEITTVNKWTIELEVKSRCNVLIPILVDLQERNQLMYYYAIVDVF